jgi:hypothetical protein
MSPSIVLPVRSAQSKANLLVVAHGGRRDVDRRVLPIHPGDMVSMSISDERAEQQRRIIEIKGREHGRDEGRIQRRTRRRRTQAPVRRRAPRRARDPTRVRCLSQALIFLHTPSHLATRAAPCLLLDVCLPRSASILHQPSRPSSRASPRRALCTLAIYVFRR